jgi:putative flippase GtrA
VSWTFARFALVGLANTCAYFIVYLPIVRVAPYLLAHAIGLVCSMSLGFLLHSHFTFRTKRTWLKAALFPLATVTNVAAHTAGLVLAVEALGLNSALGSVLAVTAALPITFVATRMVLVGRRGSVDATARGIDCSR